MMVLWHNEEIHLHRHDKLNCKRRRHWNMFRCDISFPHYYKSTLVFVPIEAKLCKWSFLWDHFLFPSVLRTHSIHSVESAGQLINPIKIQNVDTDWIFMFSVKIIYSLLATWGLSLLSVCINHPFLPPHLELYINTGCVISLFRRICLHLSQSRDALRLEEWWRISLEWDPPPDGHAHR